MSSVRWRIGGAGIAALCVGLAACSPGGSAKPAAVVSRQTALWRACTEQATLASSVGQMRACVDNRHANERLKVSAVAAAYSSDSGYDLPHFTFELRDPASAAMVYEFSSPVVQAENVFSYSTGLINLPRLGQPKDFRADDVLQVSLEATSAWSGRVVLMASMTLTLYPRGLNCPALGIEPANGEQTGQC